MKEGERKRGRKERRKEKGRARKKRKNRMEKRKKEERKEGGREEGNRIAGSDLKFSKYHPQMPTFSSLINVRNYFSLYTTIRFHFWETVLKEIN